MALELAPLTESLEQAKPSVVFDRVGLTQAIILIIHHVHYYLLT